MILVTGANGSVGGALVKELLDNGALKVYAAARSTAAVTGQTESKTPVKR
ncbi:MAG: NAD-dependent epimerase/dehydratase family protein [Desulfuromonadaceae bacterium]|nr:NAD-dependent epimerase/dehydratase family protein [Desulfuromonadaceae bacterium]